jgi:hypothetical protein
VVVGEREVPWKLQAPTTADQPSQLHSVTYVATKGKRKREREQVAGKSVVEPQSTFHFARAYINSLLFPMLNRQDYYQMKNMVCWTIEKL